MTDRARMILQLDGFGALLAAPRDEGYQLVGPTVRDGAIVHAEIRGIEDLPAGWTETQEAGTYRLKRREDGALFGYSVGPQSWKQFFFVPRMRLFQARRKDGSFVVDADLALTELTDGVHRFVLEVGSERGAEVLSKLDAPPASETAFTRPRPSSRRPPRRWGGRGGCSHPRHGWEEGAMTRRRR